MTENLERLIVIEKEQEPVEIRDAIARECRGQLFPRSARLRTLELAGVCHPARMVSHYYDLCNSATRMSAGDWRVDGKGISAALLMARCSPLCGRNCRRIRRHAAAAPGRRQWRRARTVSASDLVSELNRQVYAILPRKSTLPFISACTTTRTGP